MNIIIAILMFLGVVSSPDEVTERMVSENQNEISNYTQDEQFQSYIQTEGIVVYDIYEDM